VWGSYLVIQLVKAYTENCSLAYWLLTIVQVSGGSVPLRCQEHSTVLNCTAV